MKNTLPRSIARLFLLASSTLLLAACDAAETDDAGGEATTSPDGSASATRASATVAASTSSSVASAGSGLGPADALPEGGVLEVSVTQDDATNGIVAGFGDLYDGLTPASARIVHYDEMPDDTCGTTDEIMMGFSEALTGLDPVPYDVARLVGGPLSLEMIRPATTDPDFFPAFGLEPRPVVEPSQLMDAELDVTLGDDTASLPSRLHIPKAISLTYPDGLTPADLSADATLKWAANNGQAVLFTFGNYMQMSSYLCVSRDDGSLVVPQSVIDAVDDMAFFRAETYHRVVVDHGGRRVSLAGRYGRLYAYRK